MISVEEALSRVLAPLEQLPPEQVSLSAGLGRVLAEDVAARRTQPPFAVSAMDGYAVRADDLTQIPVELRIVAEVPAGAGFGGRVGGVAGFGYGGLHHHAILQRRAPHVNGAGGAELRLAGVPRVPDSACGARLPDRAPRSCPYRCG